MKNCNERLIKDIGRDWLTQFVKLSTLLNEAIPSHDFPLPPSVIPRHPVSVQLPQSVLLLARRYLCHLRLHRRRLLFPHHVRICVKMTLR